MAMWHVLVKTVATEKHNKYLKLMTAITSHIFNPYSTNLISLSKLIVRNFEVDSIHPRFDVF